MKATITLLALFSLATLFGQTTSKWSLYLNNDSLPFKGNGYYDMDFDSLGRLWVICYGKGIGVKQSDGTWTTKANINGFSEFTNFLVLSDNRVAVATEKKCAILDYDLNVIKEYKLDSTYGAVSYLYADRKGNLLATHYQALVTYSDTGVTSVQNYANLPGKPSFYGRPNAYLDRGDTLWLTTNGASLFYKAPSKGWVEQPVSFNYIPTGRNLMFKDRFGKLYVGSNSSGLGEFYKSITSSFFVKVDLGQTGIKMYQGLDAITLFDGNKTVWMISYPNIISFDGETWKSWQVTAAPFGSETIYALCKGKDNKIYAIGSQFGEKTRVFVYSPNEIISGAKEVTSLPLSVSPNPNIGELKVEVPEKGVITIFDNLGQVVLRQSIETSGPMTISLANLPAGTYFINLMGKSQSYFSTMVKQ